LDPPFHLLILACDRRSTKKKALLSFSHSSIKIKDREAKRLAARFVPVIFMGNPSRMRKSNCSPPFPRGYRVAKNHHPHQAIQVDVSLPAERFLSLISTHHHNWMQLGIRNLKKSKSKHLAAALSHSSSSLRLNPQHKKASAQQQNVLNTVTIPDQVSNHGKCFLPLESILSWFMDEQVPNQ